MHERRLLGLSALGVAVAVAGCAGQGEQGDPGDPGDAGAAPPSTEVLYLSDAAFRRAELVASLVNPENGYSALRLQRYGRAWEALPVWNPRVAPVVPADLTAAGVVAPLGPEGRALSLSDAASAGEVDALLRLGREAFVGYPVQILDDLGPIVASPKRAAEYGLATDPATGRVGFLVHAEMADGSSRVALTCASCHAGRRGGEVVLGAPNDALDLGKLAVDAGGVTPALTARTLAWGPGRVDVSSADASEPARIPDVRPTRWLTYLHQDATVQQRSLASLAIRVETLIVTSQDEAVRPPREVALGMALAVWALADGLPASTPADAEAARGLAVAERACAACHRAEGFTGLPVPLAVVGTDPTLGLSPERGTGFYRVPSLRGVGSRGPLLHDASAPDLDAFFDPGRVTAGYEGGRSPGPIRGHPWNLALPAGDRAALLGYLKGL